MNHLNILNCVYFYQQEYKSTIEVTSTQTTTYDIVLNVRREEDEGMREQVDFYEVLTDLAEQEYVYITFTTTF